MAGLIPHQISINGGVYIRDRQAHATECISFGRYLGEPACLGEVGYSLYPAISASGRLVAFNNAYDGLVSGDTNGVDDVFVRDRQTRTTSRVSVGSGGAQANKRSLEPKISADGRFVAFISWASSLVPGDRNRALDVFVGDRLRGKTERVSITSSGAEANGVSLWHSMSADGRFVAFASAATNLVQGDTNGVADVFIRDRQKGTTTRVSVGPSGLEANGSSYMTSISANGRFIAYRSGASNLVPSDTNLAGDVFIRDRKAGKTARVSVGSGNVEGNGKSDWNAISADGRFVAFTSLPSNLVQGDTNEAADVFLRDRKMNSTRRVSVATSGVQGDYGGYQVSISADGRAVAFSSSSTNLVPADTNGSMDVFVRIPAH